ncbi:hybrid sensor histidine kinase/response regulator [Methylopila jiangsuensis]|uniref:histidine kinase n=1 Tax=Methylopila jiangsuensis TaxID=586230 RepID=A0A9W6JJ90_9HYPH|nr:signal transduction histidine kinase [Methylopila jiangsuensis]GLK76744.1 hybrid sensor histidine kinase/response regulator [Methylopila jiangsuensis]
MTVAPDDDEPTRLRRRIAKLERINEALMEHVERATDRQGNAYSMFQTAIMLDGRVRARTEELIGLMRRLERSNQALVEAKEEAELANRSKTRFLAGASHDLLQPLNAARLSLSTLVDMPLGEEARAVALQAERGMTTIEELIKALIEVSKLDAGVVRPSVSAIDLNELMAEIAASFEPAAAAKGLRLAVKAPPLGVESDPVMLKRILQNLVSNAVRYTAQGGVLLRARPRAGLCAIDVVDTGPGISADDRARVFDEFYRCDGGRRDEVGLGLGLSIVRRMTLALGHGLQLTSRPGLGSRFRLRLPMATAAPLSRTSALAAFGVAPPTLAGLKVALVENDDDAAAALARLLGGWGVETAAARALAELEARLDDAAPPEIALVDFHLDDGECGLDAVAALRRRFSPDLPAIVTTADHTAEVAERVRAAGCALIHKPIKPGQIRAMLSHLRSAERGL